MICNFSIIKDHFVFCELNFIVLFQFLIKYYHVFIIIVFWLGSDRPSGLLSYMPALFLSTLTPPFSYRLCLFILFHSCCSHARVFGKTLVHEFPCPIAILNGTFFFFSKRHDRNVAYQKQTIITIIIIFLGPKL